MTIIISKKTQDAEFLWVLHEVWILNIKESQASIMHHQAYFQLDPHSSPEFGTARSSVSIHLSLKIHTPRNFKTFSLSGTCPSRNITAPSWEGNTFPNIDPAPCGSRICWTSQDLRAVLPFGTRTKTLKKPLFWCGNCGSMGWVLNIPKSTGWYVIFPIELRIDHWG